MLKLKSKSNFENCSDGTTDVTRTIAFPDNMDVEFKRMFTLVLKGHIANARLIFPDGVNGKIDLLIDNFSNQHLFCSIFIYLYLDFMVILLNYSYINC